MNGFKIAFSLFIFSSSILPCSSYDETDMNELRLILIGKTGVGKSATGNSILGECTFAAKTGSQSVTTTAGFGTVRRFDRKLVVVDTPGLSDTKRPNAEIFGEISRTLLLTSPGPHAFILVVKPGRFTEEDENVVSLFEEFFGPNFQKYLIVLFTDKDRLEKDDVTIEEYVDTLSENSLNRLIRNANNRFLTMDYSKKKLYEQEEDVKRLLNMIDEMNRGNTIPYYETEYSSATEKIFGDIISKLERKKYNQNGMFSNYRDKARQMILDTFTGMAVKKLLQGSVTHLSSFVFKLLNTIAYLVSLMV